jgi:hypothetical protein
MLIEHIFADPLWGNHSPLVLGWDDDQLKPLVHALAPLLPGSLTDQKRYAVASVARSIVVESMITGRGVHYARAKSPYSQPKRYRSGDPLFTWYYVTNAMDILQDAGLIDHKVGRWCPRATKGCQSVAWATDKLMILVGPLVDASEPRGIPKQVETVVLRDLKDKTDIDYVDTADTFMMRDRLGVINEKLSQLELRRRGQHVSIPTMRRIFNGDFDRGGRLYCHGSSYQNMPAWQRQQIEFIIEGTAHPVVEIDYANLHISMAHSEMGRKIPHGDQYTIDGFDRELVKLAVNTLFNAPTVYSGILAITEELRYNSKLRAVNGIKSSDRGSCRALAEKVVAAIQCKHHRIKSYFGSDCGARFQRKDSDMAVEVMTRMIQRTGRCPLPVHDSFLVPDIDADILSQTMREVARDHGLRLNLKDSRGEHGIFLPSPPPFPSPLTYSPSVLSPRSVLPSVPFLPFLPSTSLTSYSSSCPSSLSSLPSLSTFSSTMEVTSSDLRRSGRQVCSKKAFFMGRKVIVDTLGAAISASAPKQRPKCHGPPAPSGPNGAPAARIAVQNS